MALRLKLIRYTGSSVLENIIKVVSILTGIVESQFLTNRATKFVDEAPNFYATHILNKIDGEPESDII